MIMEHRVLEENLVCRCDHVQQRRRSLNGCLNEGHNVNLINPVLESHFLVSKLGPSRHGTKKYKYHISHEQKKAREARADPQVGTKKILSKYLTHP